MQAASAAAPLTKATKVAELKSQLAQLGLDTSGKKQELYERLRAANGGGKRKAGSAPAAKAKRAKQSDGGGAAAAAAAQAPRAPAWLARVAEGQQPAATIRYTDGHPVPHPGEFFASKAAGQQAVARHPSMDLALHAGSVTLQFTVPPSNNPHVLLQSLSPAVVCAPRACGRTQMGETCWETWRKVGELSGEPPCAAGELAILARISAAVESGGLVPTQPWADFWLQAACSLVVVPGSPWKSPLIRVMCAAPNAAAVATMNQERTLTLTLHVYILRMLFYLIAYEPLSTVLKHISPPVPVVQPCYAPPTIAPCFTRAQVEGRDRFTLEGLLRSREHVGYQDLSGSLRSTLDAQLSKTLKEYQSQTVSWMLDQESMPGGLNSLFWETRQWGGGGGHEYFYAPELGELRLERPPVVRGGLLCDEMGLGKTLEIIALIVASSTDPLQPPPVDRDDITVSSRGSLIIVPEPLLAQWKEEIAGSTQPADLLSVIKCIGPHVQKNKQGNDGDGDGDSEGIDEQQRDEVSTTTQSPPQLDYQGHL